MRVISYRLSASDGEGAFWGFDILLRLQQARGRQVQEDTFELVSAGRGGKEYFTYKLSIFAWSMPVGGAVGFFYAAVFESLRPKENRML